MILKKEVKRTHDHCTCLNVYSFTLKVIGIFKIMILCLILASGASQKILIIKK